MSQEELKTMTMQIFFGGGWCIMGFVQVVNSLDEDVLVFFETSFQEKLIAKLMNYTGKFRLKNRYRTNRFVFYAIIGFSSEIYPWNSLVRQRFN